MTQTKNKSFVSPRICSRYAKYDHSEHMIIRNIFTKMAVNTWMQHRINRSCSKCTYFSERGAVYIISEKEWTCCWIINVTFVLSVSQCMNWYWLWVYILFGDQAPKWCTENTDQMVVFSVISCRHCRKNKGLPHLLEYLGLFSDTVAIYKATPAISTKELRLHLVRTTQSIIKAKSPIVILH